MITTTTYGTWLPGDLRNYVDDGVILPGDPELLERSQQLMKADPVLLTSAKQQRAFDALCEAAIEYTYALFAVSIESWHAHWLIDHSFDSVETMVGRLKTRMRQAVNIGRLWTRGFDARYCFDRDSVVRRKRYIERHAGWRSLGDL